MSASQGALQEFYRLLTRVSPGGEPPEGSTCPRGHIPYLMMPANLWLSRKAGRPVRPDYTLKHTAPDESGALPSALLDMVTRRHQCIAVPRMGWDGMVYAPAIDLDRGAFTDPRMHDNGYWLDRIEDLPEPRPVFGRSAGGGVHLYWPFAKPMDGRRARRFLAAMIERLGFPGGTETFPARDRPMGPEKPDHTLIVEPFYSLPRLHAPEGQREPWGLAGRLRPPIPFKKNVLAVIREHSRDPLGQRRLARLVSEAQRQKAEFLAMGGGRPTRRTGGAGPRPRDGVDFEGTRDSVAAAIESRARPEMLRAFRSLPLTREGSRHTLLVRLAGCAAAVAPHMTGVVEVLNDMMAEPMDERDPSLRGLIRDHEKWRQARLREPRRTKPTEKNG